MASTTTVTVAIANTQLANFRKGGFTHKYWGQVPLNEINSRIAVNRMEEIVVAGQTGTVDGPAADLFSTLGVFV